MDIAINTARVLDNAYQAGIMHLEINHVKIPVIGQNEGKFLAKANLLNYILLSLRTYFH
jgi:hypothetical protein